MTELYVDLRQIRRDNPGITDERICDVLIERYCRDIVMQNLYDFCESLVQHKHIEADQYVVLKYATEHTARILTTFLLECKYKPTEVSQVTQEQKAELNQLHKDIMDLLGRYEYDV